MMKRADIVATQPSGQQIILDVAITSSSAAGTAADDVDRIQMQKCRLYGVTCECRSMVGGETFAPFVCHSSAGLASFAVQTLWRMAEDATECRVVGSLDAPVTRREHFFQLTAKLGKLMLEQNYRVLRSSAPLAL